ncbi:LOW QUALITY PROTEIN: Hypothetical protein PHPALM_7248 [Phytophthora palmivora]|uniref:Uncharacterized protein n=1 Tax=Phytophthora palmivora TaxID=4796 RepID=A0A2P4YCT7_9STRA|nr:LOW QUALITY PROTEIN: Hypothetical protein PHPALM_7248 [Phytophthora palmivora]
MGSRHDGLNLAQRMETLMLRAQAKGWVIGGLSPMTQVNAVCIVHDMNNLVKSILRLKSFRRVSKQAQSVVIFECFYCQMATTSLRNHGFNVRKILSLRDPMLNQVELKARLFCFSPSTLRMFAVKYRDDAALSVLEGDEIWMFLKDVERVINPICFASYKLQSNENTLADVVIVFRDLYENFSRSGYSGDLLKLVEARWAACEQPLFMLTIYLHPACYLDAVRLVDTKVSGHASICKIAGYYHVRRLGGDPSTLSRELDDWLGSTYMRNSRKDLRYFETSSIPDFLAALENSIPNVLLTHVSIGSIIHIGQYGNL